MYNPFSIFFKTKSPIVSQKNYEQFIHFSDISIRNGRIDMLATEKIRGSENSQELFFEFPAFALPCNDALGYTIAVMTGKKYDAIQIDLPLAVDTINTICQLTDAEVLAPIAECSQFVNVERERERESLTQFLRWI